MIEFGLFVQIVCWLISFALGGLVLFGFLYIGFSFSVTRPIQNQPHVVFVKVRGATYRAFSGHHIKAIANFTAGFLKKCGHDAFVHQNILLIEV